MDVVRQFVLRLEKAEESKMERLKQITGQNTDTGAIKHLIRNFDELNNRYLSEQKKRKQIEAEFSELKKNIEIYFSASDKIKQIIHNKQV